MVLSCVEKEMKERKIDKTDIGYLCRLSLAGFIRRLDHQKGLRCFLPKIRFKV